MNLVMSDIEPDDFLDWPGWAAVPRLVTGDPTYGNLNMAPEKMSLKPLTLQDSDPLEVSSTRRGPALDTFGSGTPLAPPQSDEPSLGMRIALALEGFGAGYRGQEPLFLKLQAQQQKRDALKAQQKQQQLKLAQQDLDDSRQAWTAFAGDPSARKEYFKARAQDGSASAKLFLRMADKQVDELLLPENQQILQEIHPQEYASAIKDLREGRVENINLTRVNDWLGEAKKIRLKRQEAASNATEYASLAQRDPKTFTPAEVVRFDELTTWQSEINAKREQFAMEFAQRQRQREIVGTPTIPGTAKTQGEKDLALGVKSPEALKAEQEALLPYKSGQSEDDIAKAYFGVPAYRQLHGAMTAQDLKHIATLPQGPATIGELGLKVGQDKAGVAQAIKQLQQRQLAQAQALGRLDVPATVEQRSNTFRKDMLMEHGELVQAPPGITEKERRTGQYVEVNDKQRDTWNKVKTAERDAQVMFALIRPYITATDGPSAAKQAGQLAFNTYVRRNNPDLLTFNSMKEAFSSTLARFVEVGVLTQGDVTRWANALPGFGDTKDALKTKERILGEMYKISMDGLRETLTGVDPTKVQSKVSKALDSKLTTIEKNVSKEELDRAFQDLMRPR